MDSDLALARALQAQFDEEDAHEEVSSFIPEEFRFGSPVKKIRPVSENAPETSIIAPEWEDLDPTPGMVLKLRTCLLFKFGLIKIQNRIKTKP